MFPLGTVLVPFAHLPLHIFEPRYRALVRDCLAGEREFGVVLIERGSEVGGGDTRFGVGTVAHITQAAELPDGRWLLDAVGTDRFRVVRWLPDDPYPQAEVETLDEEPDPSPEASEWRDSVERLLRQVLALQVELGDPSPPVNLDLDLDLGPDPGWAAYAATILSPIGPLDTQRLLEEHGPLERLRHLERLLTEARATLQHRIAEG